MKSEEILWFSSTSDAKCIFVTHTAEVRCQCPNSDNFWDGETAHSNPCQQFQSFLHSLQKRTNPSFCDLQVVSVARSKMQQGFINSTVC